MVKARKEKDDGGPSSEEKASILESKRLQELAVSRGLLGRSRANPSSPLLPTKTILKCDGKDIVKKGHRKTKYLFAFPGLVSPIAGGKFGELTHLDSRNPTCYVNFPQGRLKLFGTIVYPKNKYLTMHFVPGRGDIVCEDCFESIVVFPEAWWIGTKEENPEELQLAMPSTLQQESHVDVDFTAGAGLPPNTNVKAATTKNETGSPVQQFKMERFQDSASSMEIAVQEVALRRSGRRSAEKLHYAISSSESEGSSDCASESSDFRRKQRRGRKTDEDTIQPISTLSTKDMAIYEKVSSFPTTANKQIGSLLAPTSYDQIPGAGSSPPRACLKQATLAAFLTKTSNAKALKEEVTEIEELSQKTESGSQDGVSVLLRKTSSKKTCGIMGSALGNGRGRGVANAAISVGRSITPRKCVTRRQSITEITSSSENQESSDENEDTGSHPSDDDD